MSFKIVLFLSLLGRSFGLFVLSPLFSSRGIPLSVRAGVAIGIALVMAPPLLGPIEQDRNLLSLVPIILKEVALGYLFGFLFSLLFEAAALAGQVIGVMSGFSATELLSFLNVSEHPFMARLFSLFAFALFLAMDFHHFLIRMLYESFQAVPLTFNLFSSDSIHNLIEATSRLFHHALSFAFFPLLTLALLIVLLSLASRFLPHLFWAAFPLQSLVGIVSIGIAFLFFIPILEKAFYEFVALTKKVLFPL